MERLVKALKEKKLTISSCESLTGGMFASDIVSISGASSVFKGAFVTYMDECKQILVDGKKILKEYISSMSKDTFVIVDPAMGDNGELYKIFDNNYAKKMTELCMQASLVIPNVTEACFMTNTPYLGKVQTKEQIEDLINKINNLGIDNVVLTSVCLKEHTLGTATKTKGQEIVYQENEEIQGYFHGTGDVFGSALVGAYVNGVS